MAGRAIVPARTSYWRAAMLAGVVLLGWAWDAALGGGRSHALAWLGGMVLVGAIGALAVHGARLAAEAPDAAVPAAGGSPPTAPTAATAVDRQLRLADPADLPLLPALERSADTLFTVAGYGDVGEPASVAEFATAAAVLVAGSPPIGFARIELVDGQAHLQGLSVALRQMKQGIGTALVEAAGDWALAAGCELMTLTTFADIPWNAPFFGRRGFTELGDPATWAAARPELAQLWGAEVQLGLATIGRRVLLCRRLD